MVFRRRRLDLGNGCCDSGWRPDRHYRRELAMNSCDLCGSPIEADDEEAVIDCLQSEILLCVDCRKHESMYCDYRQEIEAEDA